MEPIEATFVKGIRGTDSIVTSHIPQIAFVGRSNVGKSSIINALTGRNGLAREGKKPGKTTEINFYDIQHELYLVDLPGYGYAEAAPKEREKLKKLIIWYLAESGASIARVALIIDAVAGVTDFDRHMLEILRNEKHPYVLVVNKTDKLSQKEMHARLKEIHAEAKLYDAALVSAKTGKGIDDLRKKLFLQ